MPPPLFFDLSQIDLNAKPVFDKETICKANPQRYEMQQLDGIIWYDKEKNLILGYKDVTENEFWIRGHIPGRPLMPGVIMVEAAAQLASFYMKHICRSVIEPGKILYLLGHVDKNKQKKRISLVKISVQGIVDDVLVFEATVSGMRV